MKTYKTHGTAFTAVYFPIIFVSFFLPLFFPGLTKMFFLLAGGIFIFFIAILFFCPLKNYHADQTNTISSYFPVFIKIGLLQLGLVLLSINFHIIFTGFLPANSGYYHQLLQLSPESFIHECFFPWSAILLIALLLVLARHGRHEQTSLLDATFPVFGKNLAGALGAGIQMFLRNALVVSMGFIGTAIILSLYFYAIMSGLPKIQFSFNFHAILLYFLLFALLSSRYREKALYRFWHKNHDSTQLFLLQTLAVTFVFFILILLLDFLQGFLNINLVQPIGLPIPHITPGFSWQLFSWTFWLSATLYFSDILISIIRGKNLRIVILSSLVFPAVLLTIWIFPQSHAKLLSLLNYFGRPGIMIAINSICLVCLCAIFIKDKRFEKLIFNAFFCHYRGNRKRLPFKDLNGILRFMSVLFLFYLLGGIALVGIAGFALTATCIVIYVIAGIGMLKVILKNENQQTTIR